MTTREEFEELLYDHANRVADVRRYEEQGIETEEVSAVRNRRDELWFAILDAYDAQAERIRELEAALRLAREDVDVYERTLDERQANIENLEAACEPFAGILEDGYVEPIRVTVRRSDVERLRAILKGEA